jgi:hypothetical protein
MGIKVLSVAIKIEERFIKISHLEEVKVRIKTHKINSNSLPLNLMLKILLSIIDLLANLVIHQLINIKRALM